MKKFKEGQILVLKQDVAWFDTKGVLHNIKKYKTFYIQEVYYSLYSDRLILAPIDGEYYLITSSWSDLAGYFFNKSELRKKKLKVISQIAF